MRSLFVQLGAAALIFLAVPSALLAQWSSGSGGAIYYNGGNVGIGTTTPSDRLSILGPRSAGLVSLGNSDYDLLIGNSLGAGTQLRLLPF